MEVSLQDKLKKFLGGKTAEDFFAHYWQKKVFVVRAAVADADQLASPQNFIDIAEDKNFETRMVLESGGQKPWQTSDGPFEAKDFSPKKTTLFTLLVHNINLYFEEFHNFQEMMKFIPTWNFDDVMATFSNKGASVGAHIDNYNVFIFQGNGKRKWLINENPDDTYIEDIDIRLLKNFEASTEYILEPGDMIYIPPGVAHHGVSLDDNCISYSIGFKAYDFADMASSFFHHLVFQYKSKNCLKEKMTKGQADPDEISDQVYDDIYKFMSKDLLTKDNIKKWFGTYVTMPKSEIKDGEKLSIMEIKTLIESGAELYKDEFTRFNFTTDDGIILFANGCRYQISKKEKDIFREILSTPAFEKIYLPTDMEEHSLEILQDLIETGGLFFSEEN